MVELKDPWNPPNGLGEQNSFIEDLDLTKSQYDKGTEAPVQNRGWMADDQQ